MSSLSRKKFATGELLGGLFAKPQAASNSLSDYYHCHQPLIHYLAFSLIALIIIGITSL